MSHVEGNRGTCDHLVAIRFKSCDHRGVRENEKIILLFSGAIAMLTKGGGPMYKRIGLFLSQLNLHVVSYLKTSLKGPSLASSLASYKATGRK